MIRRLKFVSTLFLIILLVFFIAGAQDKPAEKPEVKSLDQILPLDPNLTVGKLDNGFSFYLRQNRRPENRAELRLVVNTGSVLEDNDQLGLAHFVEHMAFNGTEHFAKQELVKFMESIGMRFGPGLNAFTSFDETVYMIQIPMDNPKVMETAFQILEDWSHLLTFDHQEIDKERGVIIEEWRLGRGAYARMQDKQFPILFKASRYADRLPIGKKETVESFDYETLKRFYKDWYRPDLMAVIAIGDFDKATVEKLIKQHFSNLSPAPAPRPRTVYDVPDHEETLFAIATDKEATGTSVEVYYKLPLREQATIAAFRQKIVEGLYNSMLNRRFNELAQKPDPPFINAFSSLGRFIRSKEFYVLRAMVKDEGIERGLEALFIESERITRFGFTQSELERQKREMLRSVERSYAEREKRDSNVYVSEYIRHFLQGEPIPGIELEFELYKKFLPEITLDEVNQLGKKWITDRNRVIVVSAPEKEGLKVPTEEKLLSVLASAATKEITAYKDTITDQPLIDEIPRPGKVIKTRTIEKLGITEWELSNGVRVILKPTDFKEDEIVFRALSPGGTSLASDEDFIAAETAAQVISAGGLGKFNAIDLRKVLSGKVASVRPLISDLEEGLSGNGSPKDLETLFQLIYLTFTAPRADATIFNVLTSQMKTVLANLKASPEMTFMETLVTTLAQNHFRERPMTVEMVDKMNLEKSYAFYKDRFADASDFTFIFLGNLKLETMKPLVENYLGALPSIHRKENWRDLGIHPPKGIVKKTVRKGIEPKSQTAIVFTGPFQFDRPHGNAIRALSLVLGTRLRETLREELGGTYSVAVNASYDKIPDEEYAFMINFGSDPKRVEELVKVVFQQIEKLKAKAPTEKEVNDAREALYRQYEAGMKQNNWLLNQIYVRYQIKEDPTELFFNYQPSLKLLTPKVIQKAARTYLKTNNYVFVSLYPEK
jgi:zinc protease